MSSATTLVFLVTLFGTSAAQSATLEDRIRELESFNDLLTQQLLDQQQNIEEQTRSYGDSGVVRLRSRTDGPKTYYTHQSGVASVHNHPNFPRTLGLAEVQAVLNGVMFRTRHNDYTLAMPSTSSSDYRQVQDVPFPDVPPEVTSKSSVEEQIVEMREWFRAWKDQDYSQRDYRPYFKPVLCYLEGAWTTESQSQFTEPYYSTRHVVDAASWDEMHKKTRFEANTGIKYDFENLAYLPVKLFNDTDGKLFLAQWNFRFLCNPIKTDLELKNLVKLDDLGYRLARGKTFDNFDSTRGTRYYVTRQEQEDFFDADSLLENLMYEVPGFNNYPANLTADELGYTRHSFLHPGPTNVGYYHRWYKQGDVSPSSLAKTARMGFGDRSVFFAETTHENVAPIRVPFCEMSGGQQVCRTVEKRVSMAVPWEIVYLTPLHQWNPYNISYESDLDTVRANGRNGGLTADKAFDGANDEKYYLCPAHFFAENVDLNSDVSMEVSDVKGVLDRNGVVRQLSASGLRVHVPTIPDVGFLRTRYPIMPFYDEGSSTWKELEAVRDVLMDLDGYRDFLQKVPQGLSAFGNTGGSSPDRVMYMEAGTSDGASTSHTHIVSIPQDLLQQMAEGEEVSIWTWPSPDGDHSHLLILKFAQDGIKFRRCDGKYRCAHEHGRFLYDTQMPTST